MRCWQNMVQRCTNPNRDDYDNYGGRGITVCERWLGFPQGFQNFLADMGYKFEGLMLERVDNDKGYSPDNCIWATRSQQNKNRRRSRPWP